MWRPLRCAGTLALSRGGSSPLPRGAVAMTAARLSPAQSARRAKSLSSTEQFLQNCSLFWTGGEIERCVSDVPPRNRVYANATTTLRQIDSYGFDYDFTLVTYQQSVQRLIYNLTRNFLVAHKAYPSSLDQLEYDPSFAIRGLHYDENTGFLMKLDQFGNVQAGCVYHGHRSVEVEEFLQLYQGFRLSKHYIRNTLHMMPDLFSVPVATLLADVTEHFLQNNIKRRPIYLHQDVTDALQFVHTTGVLHDAITASPDHYLEPCDDDTYRMLMRLRQAGKHIFLLTNSAFDFVNAGMKHVLQPLIDKANLENVSADSGSFGRISAETAAPLAEEPKPFHPPHRRNKKVNGWTDLFDAVMCSAQKPQWFDHHLPFRALDSAGKMSFDTVHNLEGRPVCQGSLAEFSRLTGLKQQRVLYMGDHIYSDLLAPSRAAQWRTVAIIRELAREVDMLSTAEYGYNLRLLLAVEQLIGQGHSHSDQPKVETALRRLKDERARLRQKVKILFNERFGSVFRTYSHRSAFFFTLGRFCDMYTASVGNFMQYPLCDVFYSSRYFFQHEYASLRSNSQSGLVQGKEGPLAEARRPLHDW
eukprot:m.109906 g.109906  ORF g.109906 m.109906 type:complete len:586 (-) comp19169_c0_seq1:225-1982(-)